MHLRSARFRKLACTQNDENASKEERASMTRESIIKDAGDSELKS